MPDENNRSNLNKCDNLLKLWDMVMCGGSIYQGKNIEWARTMETEILKCKEEKTRATSTFPHQIKTIESIPGPYDEELKERTNDSKLYF